MLHLHTAGIETVGSRIGHIRAAHQYIVKLLDGCCGKDSSIAGLNGNLVALGPFCRIGQQHAALGCAHQGCLIVRSRCTDGSAGNIGCNQTGQTTVTACQHSARRNVQGGFCLDGVIARLDADAAAGNRHIRLGGLDAVAGCIDLNRTVLDYDRLLCPDAIHFGNSVFCNDGNITAGDLQVVVAVNAVLGGCGYHQCTLSLDGHIILGEDGCGIRRVGFAVIYIVGGAGNQVQRGIFRILNQNRRCSGAGNIHAVEEQLYGFRICQNIRHIHHDLAVRQGTINIISTGGVNGHRFVAVAQGGMIALDFNITVLQVDIRGFCLRYFVEYLTLQQRKVHTVEDTVSGQIRILRRLC